MKPRINLIKVILLLYICLAANGCRPISYVWNIRVTRDHWVRWSTPKVMDASDFEMISGYRTRRFSFAYVHILGDGTVNYIHLPKPGLRESVWQKSVYRISPEMLHDLQLSIRKGGFFRMQKEYVNRWVFDGTAEFIWIKASGKDKCIYLENYTPHRLKRFYAIQEAILAQADLADAKTSPLTSEESFTNYTNLIDNVRQK